MNNIEERLDPQSLADRTQSVVSNVHTSFPGTGVKTMDKQRFREDLSLQVQFYKQVLDLFKKEFIEVEKGLNKPIPWWKFLSKIYNSFMVEGTHLIYRPFTLKLSSMISSLQSKIDSSFPSYGDEEVGQVKSSEFGKEILSQIGHND